MLEYSLAQLLTPKDRKPPGLVPYFPDVKENSVIAQKVPKSKASGGKKMSKLEQKKGGDSHDSNFALVNVKSDSAEWTNNVNKDDQNSMFSWGWTDLLEVAIIMILFFFLYQFIKKRINKTREKKITRTTRNLVAEMKASRDTASITMPLAPSMTSIAMPSASSMVPFHPAQTTMVVPVHKAMPGTRAIPYSSNIYKPP